MLTKGARGIVLGLLVAMFLLWIGSAVSAEDNLLLSERVRRLEQQVRDLTRRVLNLEDQGGTGSVVTVVSSVDLSCVDGRKQAYPYQRDSKVIEAWLKDCRNQVSSDRCVEIERRNDMVCFNTAMKLYPYQADANVENAFSADCKVIRYQCAN